MILGLIYAYRYSKKRVYLGFLIASLIMLLMSLIDIFRVGDLVRNLFFTYQTLLTFLLVYYMSIQNKEYWKTKTIYRWSLVYLVFGLLRSWTVFGWQIGHEYYEWFALISCVPIIFICYSFLKVRVLLTVESRPQQAPKHIPSYIYIIAIMIGCVMLVVIYNPTVQYIEDGAAQAHVLELNGDKMSI